MKIRNLGESLPLARTSLLATPSAGDPQRPRLVFLGMLFILFSFVSCVSMQEDVYSGDFSESSEIMNFEKHFSEIDAKFFESDLGENKDMQKKADKLVSDIDQALKDVTLKKAFAARLNALAGLASFDLGRRGRAKKYFEEAESSFKGDARSLVLSSRLGIEKNLLQKVKLYSDKSIIVLELALRHYSAQEYSDAAAKFDEAFLSLEPFYRESYKDLRDTSWSLRNLKKNGELRNSELLELQNLTVMQMLLLANRYPEMLYNYTSGKDVSDKELFNKIAGSGLLNPVSKPLDSDNAVTKNSAVTRLIAARFFWNLYNQRKNTPNELTKYSEAYKNKKRSPVLDVRLDSPDFDAVLGCVESEIMHLEDGIEFGAEKEVSGMEFDESIRRMK